MTKGITNSEPVTGGLFKGQLPLERGPEVQILVTLLPQGLGSQDLGFGLQVGQSRLRCLKVPRCSTSARCAVHNSAVGVMVSALLVLNITDGSWSTGSVPREVDWEQKGHLSSSFTEDYTFRLLVLFSKRL